MSDRTDPIYKDTVHAFSLACEQDHFVYAELLLRILWLVFKQRRDRRLLLTGAGLHAA